MPGANTTVTTEPCSAFPLVVPTQVTVVRPAATALHGKPSKPVVVETTAIGTVPGGTPTGTVTVRFQAILATTVPGPLTAPLTWHVWPL
jgi:hypothetical protein